MKSLGSKEGREWVELVVTSGQVNTEIICFGASPSTPEMAKKILESLALREGVELRVFGPDEMTLGWWIQGVLVRKANERGEVAP